MPLGVCKPQLPPQIIPHNPLKRPSFSIWWKNRLQNSTFSALVKRQLLGKNSLFNGGMFH
jgi:hypothetical protein